MQSRAPILSAPARSCKSARRASWFYSPIGTLFHRVLLTMMVVVWSRVPVLGAPGPKFRESAPGIGVAHAVRDEPWSIHIVRVERTQPRLRFFPSLAFHDRIGLNALSDQVTLFPKSLGVPVAAINGDFYATKGTVATTAKLANSVINFKVVADNAIYLVTTDSQSPTGYNLWYSDGTVTGTRFIEDVPAYISENLDSAVVIQTVGVNV